MSAAPFPDRPLVIVANRLPVRLRKGADGGWSTEPTSGGLVTALEPVVKASGGTWIGWPGVLGGRLDEAGLRRAVEEDPDLGHGRGYTLEPVPLTAREWRDFYIGFSNEILWPLCHGFPGRCRYEPRYWHAYREVNARFAGSVRRVADPDAFVWVHDYHLMAVGEELRSAGFDQPTGFFLHIPFPAPEVFEQLPWADEVLRSLSSYDLVGFQTERDRRNFLACLGPARTPDVGTFPISIDLALFREGAVAKGVEAGARALRSAIGADRILLGVDRLDYTKGIPQKLRGFERALEKYPELRGRVALFQLVVPSRERIPEYDRMKKEIERLVGRINGRFTNGGWVPVLYQFGRKGRDELLAMYRAADVALVTPLRDGMNLVSKEFCAASIDGRGVLVLSRFAGSADELGEGALVVNPHDVEALADGIREACTMEEAERHSRMELLHRRVASHDVHDWVASFLAAAESGRAAAKERAAERAGARDGARRRIRTERPGTPASLLPSEARRASRRPTAS